MKHRIVIPSALLLSLLCAPCFAESYESKLQELDKQISEVTNEFSERTEGYQRPSLDSRLSDGLVLQAAGDHQRAGNIFMDIVSHEEWRGRPGYQSALLNLARSLYEDGYYRLSQKHLIDLLRNGAGNERTEGVMLLLQVAQKTGDWAEVNNALVDVSDFSTSPAYLYIMGRAMFLQGDFSTARSSLENMKNGQDEWSVKAEYLLGVLDVQDRELDSALHHFENVSRTPLKFRSSQDVIDLAILAQARIYYEQTQWSKAIDCYQKLAETSPYFPAVLYEMGWTHVRLEDYQAAQQKFELLLLSYPEDSHALETRRLLADLKRELGQYDDAVASYQKLVDEFSPIMTQMETEATNLDNRKVQLQRSIEAEQYDSVQIVPERAKGLVEVGTDVNRVEKMINALTESDANTSASETIVAEINAALQSDASIRNLPEFQQYSMKSRDILIHALLLGYDFTLDYDSSAADLTPIAEEVSRLPRTQQEREMLKTMQLNERDEREAKFHHLQLQSESLRHRTKILKSWLSGGRATSLTDNERAEIESEIDRLETRMLALKQHQKTIEASLSQLRSIIGTSDEETISGMENLERFRNELEMRWAKADSSNVKTEYRELISQERNILARLDTLNGAIDNSVNERVRDFRARLEREAELVEAEKHRYISMKSDVGQAAGEISARYWQAVYEQVRDMVLNADLGMVDIAWLQKDARSKALSTAIEERKKEREVLEQDFRQFLKESGQE